MSVQWVYYVIQHSSFCMHTFSFIEHAIGASDATASFELQVNPEGQEGNPKVEVQQVGLEEPEEEIECPNHEPASFVKGKPQSILSLPLYFRKFTWLCYTYWCITYRSCDETLATLYSILVQISYLYLVIELGPSSGLDML